MAKEVTTGEIVALKRIRTENEKEGVYSCLIISVPIMTSYQWQHTKWYLCVEEWMIWLSSICFQYENYGHVWAYLSLISLSMQFPISAIREIKILNRLHHENIVKLKEVVMSQGNSSWFWQVSINKIVSAIMRYSCITVWFMLLNFSGYILQNPDGDKELAASKDTSGKYFSCCFLWLH